MENGVLNGYPIMTQFNIEKLNTINLVVLYGYTRYYTVNLINLVVTYGLRTDIRSKSNKFSGTVYTRYSQ